MAKKSEKQKKKVSGAGAVELREVLREAEFSGVEGARGAAFGRFCELECLECVELVLDGAQYEVRYRDGVEAIREIFRFEWGDGEERVRAGLRRGVLAKSE